MRREALRPRLLGRRVPLPLAAWLTLVWTALWGEVSVGTVLGGLVTGLVVTWLLPMPPIDRGIRLHPLPLVRFLAYFAFDLVISTGRVVFYVLRPGDPPAQFVRVPLRTTSEPITVLVMVAISTVPGSLVVERYPGELLLHVLGRPGDVAEPVRRDVAGLEERIVTAFGTSRDKEELV
ncbi:Na+/H+ antiporter subunit E [Nonomuraea fastidiosa]|jgi:multicomponent Na+:H+ antiporter subunit E|uniref:Na+/H+ antiporter subunit E n=1 Tax=Nonomuraea TaxID=83681 RepID=UPI00324B5285